MTQQKHIQNIVLFFATTLSVISFSIVFDFSDVFTIWVEDNRLHLLFDVFFGLLVGGNLLFLKYYMDLRHLVADLEAQTQQDQYLRERFTLVMEGSQDGVWDWDIKAGTCYYSRIFKLNLGYSEMAFPPVIESFYGVMEERDVARFDEALQHHIMAQKPFDLECQLRTKHAGLRWFKISAKAVFDSEGEIERLVGSMRDIQYRIGIQQTLNEELQRVEYIFNRNPALIVAFDKLGNILRVNPKACLVSGYDEMDLIGQNWWEIFFPNEADEHYQALVSHFREQGEISNYKMAMKTKDGEERVISWTSLNKYDENAKIDEIVGFGIDITDGYETALALKSSQTE